MAFLDYTAELQGAIPRLDPNYAGTIINRAWAQIRDMRLWSFLIGTSTLYAPAAITTGLITCTLGSNQVTCDAAASAVLLAVAITPPPIPPLANTAGFGTGRQIRISSATSVMGPLYSIMALDSTVPTAIVLTLDRVYTEASTANSKYNCYRAYYAVPVSDWVRYFTIDNVQAGYAIRKKNLYRNQEYLNSIDAQRGGTGDAYNIASYKPDEFGNIVHEWYPHPVNATPYIAQFQRRGLPLSITQDLPASIPSYLLMSAAMIHACNWALMNVATYPDLGNVNWIQARMVHEADFKRNIIQCIKQDDEINPLLPFLQGGSFDFPMGGQFLQSHDVSSIFGN